MRNSSHPFVGRWYVTAKGRVGRCSEVKRKEPDTQILLQFGSCGPFEWKRLRSLRIAKPTEIPQGLS